MCGAWAKSMSVDLTFVEHAFAHIGRTPDAVIPILQAVQDHYGYLPEDALQRICAISQITPATVSGVATFYDMFRHEPSGKHIVHVCHGTACHVGGAERVEDALRRHCRVRGRWRQVWRRLPFAGSPENHGWRLAVSRPLRSQWSPPQSAAPARVCSNQGTRPAQS